ncbi:MAG: dihydroorotate dehydrogenase electron transfer subunit [Thermodesulfobacteriota bacterium]
MAVTPANACQETGQVRKLEDLGPHILRLTVDAPAIAAAAKPGQFVMARLGTGQDPLLRRPFSVHQTTAQGTLQLLFRVVGRVTRQMAALRPGDELALLGPLGRGFRTEAAGGILVAGGMGVAPLLFLAKTLAQALQGPPPILLFGARTAAELVATADFRGLGITVQETTDDGSRGRSGLVTGLLAETPTPGPVYACGPWPMLRAVAGLCARASRPCQVSLETGMACGTGVCLGCAVPRAGGRGFLHVCSDGPVVLAEDVGW